MAHATFSPFVCSVDLTVFFPVLAAVVTWTRRWKPFWIPYGGNFQKASEEEWEQEVLTSDDPLQECGHHWQDPSTWCRRAQELSEKEIFACLTRTDSIRGSDSPCEPYCAPKTLDFDYVPRWCTQSY